MTNSVAMESAELIAAGFHMYKGGKIPDPVIVKVDAWLRRAVRTEPRAVKVISHPSAAEQQRRQRY